MNNDETIARFAAFVRQGMQSGMTRRAFLRRGVQLGLSLPTILGVLAACAAEVPQRPAAPSIPTAVIARAEPTQLPPPPTQPPATATVAPTPTPVPVAKTRFAVIGDYGLAGEFEQAIAALVKSWQPAFIVTLGDNNYPDGIAATIDANVGQYYHEFIGNYQGSYGPGSPVNRFFPVLGNHDWQSGTIKPYLDYFSPPGNGHYYTFDQGPARFFMLDSMPGEPDGITPDSVQGQWLKGELAASTARWKIVAMHHAPFTSGHNGSSDWMQWPYKEWGASIVLAGHDHIYERIERDGMIYLVNGLGGGARYALGCCPQEGSKIFFNQDHGALLIEIDDQQLTSQFIRRSGEVVDTVVMK